MAKRKKSLAVKSMELAGATPYVMGQRMMQMSQAGLTPGKRDQEEFYRMWSEKVTAFSESWNAMAYEMFRQQQQMMMSSMTFWFNPLSFSPVSKSNMRNARRATDRVLNKGIAPIHRKAMSNARRLHRKQ